MPPLLPRWGTFQSFQGLPQAGAILGQFARVVRGQRLDWMQRALELAVQAARLLLLFDSAAASLACVDCRFYRN